MCNPCNREEICKLSKAIMESQGFENLVQQMLPKVIAAIQETNEAPKLQPNHHLIISNIFFIFKNYSQIILLILE